LSEILLYRIFKKNLDLELLLRWLAWDVMEKVSTGMNLV
jgi:hypothetical protein